jgi:hypothetical protein
MSLGYLVGGIQNLSQNHFLLWMPHEWIIRKCLERILSTKASLQAIFNTG